MVWRILLSAGAPAWRYFRKPNTIKIRRSTRSEPSFVLISILNGCGEKFCMLPLIRKWRLWVWMLNERSLHQAKVIQRFLHHKRTYSSQRSLTNQKWLLHSEHKKWYRDLWTKQKWYSDVWVHAKWYSKISVWKIIQRSLEQAKVTQRFLDP